MDNFLCCTKGNSAAGGKPRVYFTCHSEDFDRTFDKISRDLLQAHNCAIYYTKDMTQPIPETDKDTDLGRMNLFVIPVTLKLLTQPNRAMDSDYAYAMAAHIPVLPILFESGLEAIYSRSDKFGEMQYLDPFNTDVTAIRYEEKLKKHLDSVLISDETAARIRAAFDAYIFLSYRKKDRKYANELMRLIHRKPEFRDIAVWYDEFLTLGVSFRENISRILANSKLFAMLVTPNLLEEPDGKPNFVMATEYPTARDEGMDILPAEMVHTDKIALREKFTGIPDCVDPHDDAAFHARLLHSLEQIAKGTNRADPEHVFLMGLAYLDGIDVETDRERGLALITEAAEARLTEAMKKLYRMYRDGVGVPKDYLQTAHWCQQLVSHLEKTLGPDHPDTLLSLNNLSVAYSNLGYYQKALEINKKTYRLLIEALGHKHPLTLTSLNNLAVVYSKLGNHQKSLTLKERVYRLCLQFLGPKHPDTLVSMGNLAITYGDLGEYEKELELTEQVYSLHREVLGEDHPTTLRSLSNLAEVHIALCDYTKALDLTKKAYALRCKALGKEHPDTIRSLFALAVLYDHLNDYRKALTLKETVYALRCDVLGQEHPDTLISLCMLALTYANNCELKRASELIRRALSICRKEIILEHPDTLPALRALSSTCYNFGYHNQALELLEKVYATQCRVQGASHPSTLNTRNELEYLRRMVSNAP